MLVLNCMHGVIERLRWVIAPLFYILTLPLWNVVVYFVKSGTVLHGIAFL